MIVVYILNDVSISVTLAADHSASGIGDTSWKQDEQLYMNVPCLWDDFFAT